MRILIHDYGGYNFSVQLGRELARRGNKVLYVYGGSTQIVKRGRFTFRPGDQPNFEITGITLAQSYNKYSLFIRWQQEIEYGKRLALEIESFRPEIVISANSPLDAQRIAIRSTRRVGARFIFWMQDAISLVTRQTLNRKSSLLAATVGSYYTWLERDLLNNSDVVIPISNNYLELMRLWAIDAKKINIIPNWAPLDEIFPLTKNNAWAERFGLCTKFCFLYTGILGYKHNPDLLVNLAMHWNQNNDVVILVASEGPGADWLSQQKSINGIDNLELIKFQSYKEFPLLLATGDVAIAILRPDASPYSIPSKILNYLCSGKSILAGLPANNPAAKTIADSDSGIVVPPDDRQAWLDWSEELYKDLGIRDRHRENGLKYAKSNFNIVEICDKFEKAIL